MAIYTGVADANGDFTVPFSSNYTDGQKITVTAEKDSAIKTVELFAPSDFLGGGTIQFSGTLNNFPNNIGFITLSSEITGVIQPYAFDGYSDGSSIFKRAMGLKIECLTTSIGNNAFQRWGGATFLEISDSNVDIGNHAFIFWSNATSLKLPANLQTIGNSTFSQWSSLKKIDIPANIVSMGTDAFFNTSSCDEVICRATTPPLITSTTFDYIKSTCIFKVPAGSVAAYQAAPNWSVFAARIQAI